MKKIAKYIGLAIVLSILGLSLYYYFHLKPMHDKRNKLNNGISALKSSDFETAFEELLPYAKEGNPLAQRIVGDLYAFGWGTEQDFNEAVKWLRLADERHGRIGEGEYYEAKRFEEEYGNRYGDVSFNAKNAVMYYKSSAEVGYVKAAERLAEIYGKGLLGFTPDPEKASYWQEYATNAYNTETAR